MIENMRTYIATCPLLDNDALINIDDVGNEPVTYSIDIIPAGKIIKTDVLGYTTREFQFQFTTRAITSDQLDYLNNSKFYENFSNWIETQDNLSNYPIVATNQEALKIECLDWANLFSLDSSGDTGVYRINCKFTYKQKGVL